MAKDAEDLAAQAERICELRDRKHLTQPQVAEAVGVSLRGYQAWEAGHSDPSVRNLKALAEVFGVSADYIACGFDRPRVGAPDVNAALNGDRTQLDRIELKLDTILGMLTEAADADARLKRGTGT